MGICPIQARFQGRQVQANVNRTVCAASSLQAANEAPFKWIDSFSWLNERTLIASGTDGVLKRVDLNTNESKALPTPQGYFFSEPGVCGVDSVVAAGGSRESSTQTIFRMNSDGSKLQQLTHGSLDAWPLCSPDAKWLFYVDLSNNTLPKLMRVSTTGGVPESFGIGIFYSFSHDGKLLALQDDTQGSVTWFSTASWQKMEQEPIPAWLRRAIGFTPDNKSVLLITSRNGSGEIWEQPLDAYPPRQFATFPGRHINAMSSSPSGAQIAFTSVTSHADAVVLQDRSR